MPTLRPNPVLRRLRRPASNHTGPAMTTYHGGAQVDHAQAVLDQHVISSADGRCLACQLPGPCPQREAAARAFAASLRLPRRSPGATRPELINARRIYPANPLARVR